MKLATSKIGLINPGFHNDIFEEEKKLSGLIL